ncbi:unnamed protein product [Thlaspi arvense]|uniref:Uncharacterized protein n=1 Tax=Thlaspi arvense TaxID=13288 RepID=A0AAU9SG88_THLAR|nr:unnamed protein product [Thlaspi arvense]
MPIVTDYFDGDGRKNNSTVGFGCLSSSSSSSSIGKDSDDDEGGDNEAESPYKGPLDMMESLEEVLPIRRGISKFYNGKSKSFKNLMDFESSPMKDLGRPENHYSRRRINLLSHRICNHGGISKKPVKTTFTAVSPSFGDDSSSTSSLPRSIPPLYPKQSKDSLGNCVPVVVSPRCFKSPAGRNIHNVIC